MTRNASLRRGLFGQSLWSIVHWDHFDELEAMQTRSKSGDRSIMGFV